MTTTWPTTVEEALALPMRPAADSRAKELGTQGVPQDGIVLVTDAAGKCYLIEKFEDGIYRLPIERIAR